MNVKVGRLFVSVIGIFIVCFTLPETWRRRLIHMQGPPGMESLIAVNQSHISTNKVNCGKIYGGDEHEINKAQHLQVTQPRELIPDEHYLHLTEDCDEFITRRGYVMSSLTAEEEAYPLAYSIVVYKDIEQVERLLRVLYRPQNFYCFHVDLSSPVAVHAAVAAIARCFPNVFVASRLVDVEWGTFSVLEAEFACMKDLLMKSGKWKYFINLTGQEWPLKTNWELVQVLKAVNGANLIAGSAKQLSWYIVQIVLGREMEYM